MTPVRIQRKRTAGWRMPEGTVYVGRPSRWGNPFRVFGGTLCGPPWQQARESWSHLLADQCVAAYVTSSPPPTPRAVVETFRTLIEVRLRDEPDRLRDWLRPLAGRNLACWCPLDQPCHADVLIEVANR